MKSQKYQVVAVAVEAGDGDVDPPDGVAQPGPVWPLGALAAPPAKMEDVEGAFTPTIWVNWFPALASTGDNCVTTDGTGPPPALPWLAALSATALGDGVA